MVEKETFAPGCYVDGARGIYATDAIVDLAQAYGFAYEHNCDDHDESCFDSEFAGCQWANEFEDEVDAFMNENYPLDGHYWGRSENGDWGLWEIEE